MSEPSTSDIDNQLVSLQSQIAFMEDMLDALNDIVTAQSQQLADQQRQLQLLFQKLTPSEQGTHASEIQPFDVYHERPPHY